jgi:putative Holliday junction resolvase
LRVLALDIGEVRVGIAASDATGTVASPVKVLPAPEVFGLARSFRRVLEDFEPDLLVCGRVLREEGLSEREMRGKLDMVAASLFLQAWLDAQKK